MVENIWKEKRTMGIAKEFAVDNRDTEKRFTTLVQEAYFLDMFSMDEWPELSMRFRQECIACLKERYGLSVEAPDQLSQQERQRIKDEIEIKMRAEDPLRMHHCFYDGGLTAMSNIREDLHRHSDGALKDL